MARIIQAAWLALAALMLSACAFTEDKTPDYRYRLTVEVETPKGLKTGSSVIEITQNMGRSAGTGFGKMIMRRPRGEAVAIDLPSGRTLFALLRSENDIEWAEHVMQMLAPKTPGEPWEEAFDNVLFIKGKVEVPRIWRLHPAWDEVSAYPMLVTFGDLDDPTSVAEVNPDDLAANFGVGVKLKRITVELTDDPVTSGIEERLGWFDASFKKYTKDEFPKGFPVGDFKGLFKKGAK